MNLSSEFASVEQRNAESESISGEEVAEEEDEWYTADLNVTAVSVLQNVNNVLARGVWDSIDDIVGCGPQVWEEKGING